MQRIASIAHLDSDSYDTYLKLHAEPWSGVLKRISESKIQNYSIFLKTLSEEDHLLFSYFEYIGDDFEADMKHIAADPETQRWWDICKPCLTPVEPLKIGEVWATMQSIFFHE